VGRRCASQNAGWLLWGLFFASFLWASKEMKRKKDFFSSNKVVEIKSNKLKT